MEKGYRLWGADIGPEFTPLEAYLPVELAEVGTELAVEVLGEPRPARVVAGPLWDPAGERLRA